MTEFGMLGTRSFCAREEFSNVAQLYYFGLAVGAYRLERATGSFASRSSCESAAPSVVSQFAQAFESTHVKGFCTFERPDILGEYSYFVKVLIEL